MIAQMYADAMELNQNSDDQTVALQGIGLAASMNVLAEAKIRQSIKEGSLDEYEGKGQPLQQSYDIDYQQAALMRMLKDAKVIPLSMELNKQIEAAVKSGVGIDETNALIDQYNKAVLVDRVTFKNYPLDFRSKLR